MSTYPWIIDSATGTTPSVSGFLQVVSPNGLYLNSTTYPNSTALYMKGFISSTSTPISGNYFADQVKYTNNSSGAVAVYQTSNSGIQPTIYTDNEDIIITSQMNGNPYYSGSGRIDLYASGLYLNGNPIGGGVTDIQASTGISVNQNTGSVQVSANLSAGSGIGFSYPGGNTIQIDNTGSQGNPGPQGPQGDTGAAGNYVQLNQLLSNVNGDGGGTTENYVQNWERQYSSNGGTLVFFLTFAAYADNPATLGNFSLNLAGGLAYQQVQTTFLVFKIHTIQYLQLLQFKMYLPLYIR
jgi:hypothetical protein